MKFLVTGGAGFIGSHIVERLLKEGHFVRVLDNFSSGKRENLVFIRGQSPSEARGPVPLLQNFELIEGDIRDKSTCDKSCQGIDYVLHQAALRSVPKSVLDPESYNEVNICGTLNMLQAASKNKVKRFVLASSSSIYGDTTKFPQQETDLPLLISPYALSKLTGEYYCRIFSKIHGLETACLRYFNVFGPRQNPESVYSLVVPIFMDCLLKGRSPEIHWDGKQSRDFNYVDNVVLGNILAAETPGVSGEVFNIATQEEYSVLDIFQNLKDILNVKNIRPVFKPKRAGDVRRTFADISKAVRLLKFKPQTRFRPGLEKTVKWFLESGLFIPKVKGKRLEAKIKK